MPPSPLFHCSLSCRSSPDSSQISSATLLYLASSRHSSLRTPFRSPADPIHEQTCLHAFRCVYTEQGRRGVEGRRRRATRGRAFCLHFACLLVPVRGVPCRSPPSTILFSTRSTPYTWRLHLGSVETTPTHTHTEGERRNHSEGRGREARGIQMP